MYRPLTGQDKVTSEWNSMAGEWDDVAGGYRDQFVKLLWEETGYSTADSRKDLVVLDFGCATGLLAETIRVDVKHYIGVDAADQMVEVFNDKIRAGDWQNVDVHCVVLAQLDEAKQATKKAMEALMGKVDIVTASSVLNFIPKEDMRATVKILGRFLKPGGLLCHSDWIKSGEYPDGMDEEKAKDIHEKAGLQPVTMKQLSLHKLGQDAPIFLGVAMKSS